MKKLLAAAVLLTALFAAQNANGQNESKNQYLLSEQNDNNILENAEFALNIPIFSISYTNDGCGVHYQTKYESNSYYLYIFNDCLNPMFAHVEWGNNNYTIVNIAPAYYNDNGKLIPGVYKMNIGKDNKFIVNCISDSYGKTKQCADN
jgi:hypothetical protein